LTSRVVSVSAFIRAIIIRRHNFLTTRWMWH
jgi:hypothetical protein